ncbi:MAG: ATP-binding protein [Methanosphaera sp.]|nr:ATP-binding protein [Methanosphaera sp.]
MLKNQNEIIKFIKNEVINIPSVLNNELTYNNKRFNHRTDFNEIKSLVDEFIDDDSIDRYIVLPGLRDVGKSTLLFQIYEYLMKKRDVNPQNILYLSADNLVKIFNCSIMDAIDIFLNVYHTGNLRSIDEKIFLLIDEAQYDVNWSVTGKIIFDSSKNVFMIFTGSSALDLEYNVDSARRLLKIPITPLNYSQHLKLKYDYDSPDISNALIELIFNGDIDQACKMENKIIKSYPSIEDYSSDEWNNYLKYGGFPSSFYHDKYRTLKKLEETIERVILVDMPNISQLSRESILYSSRLLYFFAQQNPGQISRNSISNFLDCHINTVNNIIDTLERTYLIFHLESFTSSPKRRNKPFKYYYATPSLRHALSYNLGIASTDPKGYEGILFENLVASTFNNLKIKNNRMFNIYYDSRKKDNVDFLIQRCFENPIPIEVGIGKKTKRQVKNAIEAYDSSHGIIISDTTQKIKKDGNIIYLPLETFSFL